MNSRPLMLLRLTTSATEEIGSTPHGKLSIFPVIGGSFEGERLRGKVLAGGGDWVTARANGTFELDLRVTLADTDLRKVVRMCELAGVRTRFPFLHDDLAEFSARLPETLLMEGGKLRQFYKDAMRGFLPDAIIDSIKQGFYVTELMGMGVNGVTGDYSRGAAGFWIENGALAFPVSELTVAGNLKDMFARLVVANDLEFRTGADSPTLRIDDLTVAGA